MSIRRTQFIVIAALAAMTISCAPQARVGVYADVAGPPALAFETEPYLVPLPGTYAYGLPDYDVDLYYSDGYYWRPWQGRWYRSAYYDRGWVSFGGVPAFYTSLPRDWRSDYHSHRWRGNSWDYARVPRHEVERNWSTWKRERRWDDDQRRYTGDRRWHDDRDRHAGNREWDGRNTDRRSGEQTHIDRREPDRREQTYDRREPDRREVDGRVYETREVERRTYDARQPVQRREVEQRSVESQRRPAERREIEQRAVEVERRPVERREVERREVAPGRRVEPRPVVQERRTTEPRQVDRDQTPRRRGPVIKDENRDGIDDSKQRPR